jgi:hypothetical protein
MARRDSLLPGLFYVMSKFHDNFAASMTVGVAEMGETFDLRAQTFPCVVSDPQSSTARKEGGIQDLSRLELYVTRETAAEAGVQEGDILERVGNGRLTVRVLLVRPRGSHVVFFCGSPDSGGVIPTGEINF